MYLGEFSTTGKTFDFGFTTVNSSGVPAAFSSGGITVYRDNSTVANTTGITLTSTFAGVVGHNVVRIAMAVTSTFYNAGGEYRAVVSSGAASESLAGYTLAHWSVRRNTPNVVSTAVSISTASLISTAQTMASVASITSTVEANVRLWLGAAPSTLGAAAHVRTDLALWRGEQPSAVVSENIQVRLVAVATTAALEINAEVADVIRTDSTGAPTGAPPASTTLEGKIGFLYAALRHGLRVGSSGKTFLDASSAVQWVKGLVDDGVEYRETLASTST